MSAWFQNLFDAVNSRPPCDVIDCFPDALERLVFNILGALDQLINLLTGRPV